MNLNNKMALVGIGNALRGDDAVGLEVLSAIKKKSLPLAIEYYESDGNITDLMELFKKYSECVCIIDAVVGIDNSQGNGTGGVICLDLAAARLPLKKLHSSSHLAGLYEAIELGKIFGELPKNLRFFGIVAQDFTKGSGFSDLINSNFDEIVEAIVRQLFILFDGKDNNA